MSHPGHLRTVRLFSGHRGSRGLAEERKGGSAKPIADRAGRHVHLSECEQSGRSCRLLCTVISETGPGPPRPAVQNRLNNAPERPQADILPNRATGCLEPIKAFAKTHRVSELDGLRTFAARCMNDRDADKVAVHSRTRNGRFHPNSLQTALIWLNL